MLAYKSYYGEMRVDSPVGSSNLYSPILLPVVALSPYLRHLINRARFSTQATPKKQKAKGNSATRTGFEPMRANPTDETREKTSYERMVQFESVALTTRPSCLENGAYIVVHRLKRKYEAP